MISSRIMNETGSRDHFIVRSAAYFRSLLACLGDNARLYMAYHDDRPIAGTIAIRFAGKVWYLYGASSNEGRNLMPNYLLQWEMIRWALDSGCFLYDFRGVSGDLSPDSRCKLYRFKGLYRRVYRVCRRIRLRAQAVGRLRGQERPQTAQHGAENETGGHGDRRPAKERRRRGIGTEDI